MTPRRADGAGVDDTVSSVPLNSLTRASINSKPDRVQWLRISIFRNSKIPGRRRWSTALVCAITPCRSQVQWLSWGVYRARTGNSVYERLHVRRVVCDLREEDASCGRTSRRALKKIRTRMTEDKIKDSACPVCETRCGHGFAFRAAGEPSRSPRHPGAGRRAAGGARSCRSWSSAARRGSPHGAGTCRRPCSPGRTG